MLKSPLLFAISILVALLSWTSVAKAAEAAAGASIGLSFALPPAKQTALEKAVNPDAAVSFPKVQAQKVQPKEEQSPKEQPPKEQLQDSGSVSLVPDQLVRVKEPLPPISEVSASENADNSAGMVTSEGTASKEKAKEQNIGVQFLKNDIQMPSEQQDEQAAELPDDMLPEATNLKSSAKVNSANLAANFSDRSSSLDDWIFEGGSGSLVAHTVGSAEGTRQWNGERTRAYYGHTDPGNGVWNLGTFSYQHEASSPEDADNKQIKRLKVQGFELEEQAAQQGIKLSLPEKLNGLDLANQAPLAALGKGGYIERLAQAHRLKLQGEEAISWARTQAYMDPDTQSWNAPGLGNNVYSISRDQERRISAIDKALRAYRQTDENSLALANLKDISLERSLKESKLDEPGFDSLTEAFKLGDRPAHPSNPANTIPDKATADIGSSDTGRSDTGRSDTVNIEASSEVTFTLPPSAPTDSHSAVASVIPSSQTVPVDETVPADEEALASIVPSTVESSLAEPSPKPAREPEALAFGATNSEAANASEPEREHSEVASVKPVEKQAVNQEVTSNPTLTSAPATSELFNSAKLSSAVEKPLISSASDKAILLEDKLNIEAKLDTNEAIEASKATGASTEASTEASMKIAANDARGNRPAPNRSWWRVEDKRVQKK